MRDVRVRFAPSPTGALHIGGVRTALYNYLLARKHKGKMILRIEDTDQSRYVPGAETYIKDALKWVGMEIDEGPDVGGPFSPYRQSERRETYAGYARQLVAGGHAYYAFDSPEELEAMRNRLKMQKGPNPQYDGTTRMEMKNSLVLPADEVSKRMEAGEPYVIRLKVPETGEVGLHDLIRGKVSVAVSQIDDKVLVKSDGMPTYHLANVVDDHLMKISHVIRGEEWLPSAPLHVLIYKFLGWENEMPAFAHLPLLLKPDGKGKLSKRDADQMGFPIFPLNWKDPHTGELAVGFKEQGYLPEALVNFLAFLGWNPGTEQELFSMGELAEAFEIERIGKAGAKFDIQKAKWYNQQYLRAKTDDELAQILMGGLKAQGMECDKSKASAIVHALRDRITFPDDLAPMAQMFFVAPKSFDEKISSKKWTDEAISVITALKGEIEKIDLLTAENASVALGTAATSCGVAQGKIMQALRLALTGGASGPDLMETMAILGAGEVASRLAYALGALGKK
ncbi:MAG: glutamate--tRNA ligase [Cyclobacteriaceae bacterium]|nr:glutamate--tRNA ligase [Cyclobacteriaceae bacterium]MCB0498878.1 glutamate--tRNA ligase [Cyclobacteriaceae bacterium]MCB9237608.1 glutamate--tRNA ligase [Flammeovirgaceae bacterium]MCO5270290.1 glutamate--tRNA ligase [Cyclobacteriaceae bacterium]MCW5902266.1 glutamate--tRNA ligase [Cyclobacteriaceae bacterium]